MGGYMRLRNKKTGEIIEYDEEVIYYRKLTPNGHEDWTPYHPEDWEDYTPAEPLIKDEKVRKAVRAWAEANDVKKVTIEKDFSTYAFYPTDTDRVSISVWTEPSLSNLSRGKIYDIAELCGEEK